jgi:hypothetical protein
MAELLTGQLGMYTAPNVFTALNNFHKEGRYSTCNNVHTVYYNAGHDTEKKCLRKGVKNKD